MGELGCKGYGCIVGGLLALAGILICILLPFSLHTIEEGKINKTHCYSIRLNPKKWALSILAFQSF